MKWAQTDDSTADRSHPPQKGTMPRFPHDVRSGLFARGARVSVRNRFQGSWSDGFEVTEATEDGYRVRRESDQYLLPSRFIADDVRVRESTRPAQPPKFWNRTAVEWDTDRYDQLQDAAWELEGLAREQSTDIDRASGQRESERSRTSARTLRQQAAELLANYWSPRRPR